VLENYSRILHACYFFGYSYTVPTQSLETRRVFSRF
jgi:hypothetical protein